MTFRGAKVAAARPICSHNFFFYFLLILVNILEFRNCAYTKNLPHFVKIASISLRVFILHDKNSKYTTRAPKSMLNTFRKSNLTSQKSYKIYLSREITINFKQIYDLLKYKNTKLKIKLCLKICNTLRVLFFLLQIWKNLSKWYKIYKLSKLWQRNNSVKAI